MKTSAASDADTPRFIRCDDHVMGERWGEPFVLDSDIVGPRNNPPQVGSSLSKAECCARDGSSAKVVVRYDVNVNSDVFILFDSIDRSVCV